MILGVTASKDSNPEIPQISQRINAFTIDLVKQQALTKNPPANTILSPQSVFHGMAMNYIASGGQTREQLARIFHFPEDNRELLTDLSSLRTQLRSAAAHRRMECRLANSLWLDETRVTYRKDYLHELRTDQACSVLKFAGKEQAANQINRWVSDQTHGRISKVVSRENFDSRSTPFILDEPAFVSINAVYFKADWGSQFNESETREQPFYLEASKKTGAEMMHQDSWLLYSANQEAKFLEIPYIEHGYSMYIILPREVISIRQLAEHLTSDMVVDLKRRAQPCKVDVLLPKFELKSHLGVKEALLKMGVNSAFDRHGADFDKMIVKTKEADRIYLSEIYQEAWIKVHEKGTEAAAATTTVSFSIGCSVEPHPRPVQFHADHPFLFLIVHNQSHSILFAGWISDPKA